MSHDLWRTLALVCLRKANQATCGIRFIWSLELGKTPEEAWVKDIKDLLTNFKSRTETLAGKIDLLDYLNSPIFSLPKPPGNWKELLDLRSKIPELDLCGKLENWKKYFNNLCQFYLFAADEFDRK